ncbi:transposase [Streptomyces sp. NPDC048295]|uniref:transposase n=1 Tax=Streptomyces sp. NPDC048295 TaxID=3154617 RepID=UPI00341F6EDF
MSLTDGQRARIEPLLPDRTPKQGGRWRDHREVSDAIAVKFRTGTQWVHLPERYGNWLIQTPPRPIRPGQRRKTPVMTWSGRCCTFPPEPDGTWGD